MSKEWNEDAPPAPSPEQQDTNEALRRALLEMDRRVSDEARNRNQRQNDEVYTSDSTGIGLPPRAPATDFGMNNDLARRHQEIQERLRALHPGAWPPRVTGIGTGVATGHTMMANDISGIANASLSVRPDSLADRMTS